MSTLTEIQEAVTRLSVDDQKALALWLESQAGLDMTPEDERKLLDSLNEAMCDLDAGKGIPIDEVRKRVASWAAK
jgi:hypothetical protein